MCFICDGGTDRELMARFEQRIEAFGFTMVGVGSGAKSWVDTIGLLETFGHPEMVVTALAIETAAGLFEGLVERIRAGESFTPTSPDAALHGRPLRVSAVHPTQWVHGRFAMWTNYYGERGFLPAQPAAVQILWPNQDGVCPPDRDFCHDHRNCQPLLAFPVASDVNAPPVGRQNSKRRRRR